MRIFSVLREYIKIQIENRSMRNKLTYRNAVVQMIINIVEIKKMLAIKYLKQLLSSEMYLRYEHILLLFMNCHWLFSPSSK